MAMYQSNESPIASVDPNGKVKAGPIPGEAAIMSRYMDKFAVTQIVIPFPGAVDPAVYEQWSKDHFIDRLVSEVETTQSHTVEPLVDSTFLRRAYLDVIGRLPSPEETKAFLNDTSADRRSKLIDRLLTRPEYADFWANKWADLLRPNPYHAGIKAVYNLDSYLRESFREIQAL